MDEAAEFIRNNVVISEEVKVKGIRFRKNNIAGGVMRSWVNEMPVGSYEFVSMGLKIANNRGHGRIITYEAIENVDDVIFSHMLTDVITKVMGLASNEAIGKTADYKAGYESSFSVNDEFTKKVSHFGPVVEDHTIGVGAKDTFKDKNADGLDINRK